MANSNVSGNEEDAADPVRAVCEFCGGTFPSKRSLGMHKHHRHPKDVNERRVQEVEGKARRIWSRGEDEHLLETVKELSEGAHLKSDLYQALSKRMIGRSAEAVKKRLQKLKWSRSTTSNDDPGLREREELPIDSGGREVD